MDTPAPTAMPSLSLADPVTEDCIDAFQRAILFIDVLRQRGNTYFEQNARDVPNVLSFQAEVLIDGRTLERPVNYGLARIIPPPNMREGWLD